MSEQTKRSLGRAIEMSTGVGEMAALKMVDLITAHALDESMLSAIRSKLPDPLPNPHPSNFDQGTIRKCEGGDDCCASGLSACAEVHRLRSAEDSLIFYERHAAQAAVASPRATVMSICAFLRGRHERATRRQPTSTGGTTRPRSG